MKQSLFILCLFLNLAWAQDYQLKAPENAVVYTKIPIELKGKAGTGGYLIFYHTARNEIITRIKVRPFRTYYARKMHVDAPKLAGQYQLCWESSSFGRFSERNQNYACRDIEILPADIEIKAPKSAVVAQDIKIKLIVPPNISGYLRLYDSQNQIVDSRRIRSSNRQKIHWVKFKMPSTPGIYEIRWDTHVFGKNYRLNRVLARKKIELKQSDIRLIYPKHGRAGQRIKIDIKAPPNLEGYIRLYRQNVIVVSEEVYRLGDEYEPVYIRLPQRKGVYNLRWDTHVFGWHQDNRVLYKGDIVVE